MGYTCLCYFLHSFILIFLAMPRAMCFPIPLVSPPGKEPTPPAVEVQSLSHWTARKVVHLNHSQGYNSVASCSFTVWYKYHHYLVPKHFLIPKGNPISSHFLFSPAPSPCQPLISFLSLGICLFWTFHINGITPI